MSFKSNFHFQFDNMKTTGAGTNSGQKARNTLFKMATEANPVKTMSQINFDVSNCRKFLPPDIKAYIEMTHTSDTLR